MANFHKARPTHWLARLITFVCAIYVFLAAIEVFGCAMQMVGQGAADSLFHGLKNPFAGLAVGILATALVQSSSVTTSMVVAMVGNATLPLTCAIPIIMGANIGTSVTCAVVSLGHITQEVEFRRAFAGATTQGFINLLTVAVMLPLELATGILQRGAEWLVAVLPLRTTGESFHSPIKVAVKWLAEIVVLFFQEVLGLQGPLLAAVLFVFALVIIIVSLIVITKNMTALMADRIEEWLNRVLRRSGLLGLAIGTVVTVLVQSSSITTSLLIPMFGAGVLTLEAGFPIMLGSNIGTTITALLAASVTGPLGLTIALIHLLFNTCGTLLFFPLRPMRRVPIILAEGLAGLAVKNRAWVVLYLLLTFVVLPGLGILIWKSPT